MSEKKKGTSAASLGQRMGPWAVHPLALVLGATALAIAGGTWLWRANQAELIDPTTFQLTLDRLRVTPQPEHVHGDVRKDAFDGSRLGELNLLDRDLVAKVHAAFAVQSWVESATVRKSRSGVDVDLIFRRPVALVEFGDNLLLPVDRNGIALDGGLLEASWTARLPRISVETPQVVSLVQGVAWPDDRIVAAAMIADLIGPRAHDWGIARIAHVPLIPGSIAPEGNFRLLTQQGTAGLTVLWGSPPGFEQATEAPANKKLATLEDWVSQRGSLDQIATTQTIDLRTGEVSLVSSQ
jgi:hypothetical protein